MKRGMASRMVIYLSIWLTGFPTMTICQQPQLDRLEIEDSTDAMQPNPNEQTNETAEGMFAITASTDTDTGPRMDIDSLVHQMQVNMETLSEENSILWAELCELRDGYTNVINNMLTLMQADSGHTDIMNNVRALMKANADILTLTRDNFDQTISINRLEDEMAEQTDDIIELRSGNSDQDANILSLAAENVVQDDDILTLTGKNSEHKANITEMVITNLKQESDIETLARAYVELNRKIINQTDELLTLRREKDGQWENITVLEEEIIQLMQENNELRSNASTLTQEILTLKGEDAHHGDNISLLVRRNTNHQNEIITLTRQSAVQQTNIHALASEDTFLQENISTLVESVANLHELVVNMTSIPDNCEDAFNRGASWQYGAGIGYSMQPTSILCEFSDNHIYTVIQQRVSGDTSFRRTYGDYKHGFGLPSTYTSFWLGLEAMHQLTLSGSHILRIELTDWNGASRYAEYANFRIGDEGSGYTLHIGSYSGEAGDSLTYHNGQQFTTYDRDQDPHSSLNCADSTGGGGWWYNQCHHSNLNGGYLSPPDHTSYQGIYWVHWRGNRYSYKAAVMKVRRSSP